MDLKPYRPLREAHGNEEYRRYCPRCRKRLRYHRKDGEYSFVGVEMVEDDGVVYLKCRCGNLIRTRFKPMSAYVDEHARAKRYGQTTMNVPAGDTQK